MTFRNPFTGSAGISRRSFLASGVAASALLAASPRAALAAGDITLWTPGGSDVFCQIHTDLIQRFAAGRDDLTGAVVQCGLGQATEYTQALIGSIAGGVPPDISMLWDSPVSLSTQGAFLPLDDMMAGSRIPVETWPAGLLKSCQFKGQTFGLPVTAGVYGMWYNEELFEAKGIPSDRDSFPKTWAELRALSKEFTEWNGDRLQVAGFMPPREAETIPIWSALNGGQIFDEANLRYTIDSEQNVEMFNFFIDWLDEEYKGDVNLVDRSANFRDGYPNPTTGMGPAFRENRLAGVQSGCWLMGDIYGDPVPVFERWNIAAHPVGPSGSETVSGTWPNWFVIPVGSRNPEAAFAYLETLSLEGVIEWYRQIPDVPTNLQVHAPTPDVVVEKRGEAFAEDVTQFLQEQAAIVTPMWNSPAQAYGQDQLARAIERIYTKASSVTEALGEAQSAAQAELERVLAG